MANAHYKGPIDQLNSNSNEPSDSGRYRVYKKDGFTPKQADEAVSGLNGAASTLWQLEALFKAISNESKGQTNIIHQLANMGAYLSCDIANLTDCITESLAKNEEVT